MRYGVPDEFVHDRMNTFSLGSGDNRILIYKAESGEKVIEKQVGPFLLGSKRCMASSASRRNTTERYNVFNSIPPFSCSPQQIRTWFVTLRRVDVKLDSRSSCLLVILVANHRCSARRRSLVIGRASNVYT